MTGVRYIEVTNVVKMHLRAYSSGVVAIISEQFLKFTIHSVSQKSCLLGYSNSRIAKVWFRALEELVARSMRDEIIQSLCDNLDRHLGYFILLGRPSLGGYFLIIRVPTLHELGKQRKLISYAAVL